MNGWKSWVIGALLGLLLGGVGSSLYGNEQLAAAEKRWKEEISELKAEVKEERKAREEAFDAVLAMATTLARIEAQIEAINQRLK